MIARSACLAGLVSLLGAGACGSVEADVDPDSGMPPGDAASAPADGATDGGLTSTVSFRASESATGEDVTSLVIPRPTAVVGGDVLLAHVSNRNNVVAAIAPPADWIVLRSDQSSALLKSWLLWKVAGDEEPDEYAFGIGERRNALRNAAPSAV